MIHIRLHKKEVVTRVILFKYRCGRWGHAPTAWPGPQGKMASSVGRLSPEK